MEIIRKEETDTLSVRLTTPLTEMPAKLGEIYGEVAALLGTDGMECTGAPFVVYYNMDMDNLDIEAGFPVSGASKDYGRVLRSKLPGGEQAVATHTGPYDGLEKTYTALSEFIQEKGRTAEEYMYEEYLNSPEDTPPEKLQTNIYFILK